MDYRNKWQIFEALKPNFASCEVMYEMPKVPATVKRKVIKFLRQGYSSVNRGDSGILYDALCAEFGIPAVKLLNRKASTQLYVYKHDEQLKQKAIEFSKADCAVHLMHLANNPPVNRWDENVEGFRRDMADRENKCLVRNLWGTQEGFLMDVKQLKNTQELTALATYFAKHIEYSAPVQEAVDLLNSNGSLVFSYKA